MIRYTLIVIACLIQYSIAMAQFSEPVKNQLTGPVKMGSVRMTEISEDYFPVFFPLEMPAPGSGTYRAYLQELKEDLYSNYQPSGNRRSVDGDVPMPELLAGFEGNPYGFSVPNDNDVAISNAGMIVSVINSTIYIYDETGLNLFAVSLGAFSDTLGIPDGDFDPRVRYDPLNDRFVLVFLNGFTPETSYIIVAFSQTNDPTGIWNLYALPGNPKDNNRWTDYPMIALTEEELFITGNLIIPDEPWQTGFSETLIWQMSLDKGYAGDTLDAIFWDNIYFGGTPIRNMNPVQGGSTLYGPDLYLLSNRNFSESNDTIFIMHVTGKLDEASTIVERDFAITNEPYGVPPVARQINDHTFDTNDGRILGSFLENGQIQFVANTLDPATGFCGVYHGFIDNLDGDYSVSGNIIGDDTLDIGYPNIAYTGRTADDHQSIITFDHTAPEVYAGMSAVFYNYGTYSERLNIKTGDSYVNILSGFYERWGDYTGSQLKYNEPGVIWVSGNFGQAVDFGPFTSHENATWIASLRSNDSLPPLSVDETQAASVQLFPNPSFESFTIDLNIPEGGSISFTLYNSQGQLVEHLLNSKANAGMNRFQFRTNDLKAGTYLLEVKLNQVSWYTTQVVKQ